MQSQLQRFLSAMGNTMCCSDVRRSDNYKIPPQAMPPQQVSPQPSPRQRSNRVQTSSSLTAETREFAASVHARQASDVPPLPSELEQQPKEMDEMLDTDPAASDSETEEPPKAPMNWQKGELLGSGAFGRVFKCLDHDTGELFACKQVPLNKEEHNRRQVEEYIRTVKSEIAHLSRLKHENIVQYKGTSVTDEGLNIFLEYVPGGSVASLLSKFGPFHEAVIRIYTKQILQGLEYMHKLGFMHRDIKGANILVDKSSVNKATGSAWRLKLADFGASKEIENLATIGSVAAKSVKGTPYWMAPEIIKQTGHGRPADIWSVGCTIIEMATGKPPWIGLVQSPVSAMFHIASSKEPPPLPEHLSPEAIEFLQLCFNRVPKQRPNASTLLKHPFVTTLLTAASMRSPSPAAQSPERMQLHNRRPPSVPGLRLPPVVQEEPSGPASNRSPTAAAPHSPADSRRMDRSARRSHTRSNSATPNSEVCFSPLTLSKKDSAALMPGTINSSKGGALSARDGPASARESAMSARSKDSIEAPLQASPTRPSVHRFGVQASMGGSPHKSASMLKAESPVQQQPAAQPPPSTAHQQLLHDTSGSDEPSLMTPKQDDESSYKNHHAASYLSENSYNPMEEPSWIPSSSDLRYQAVPKQQTYSHEDATGSRDQDKVSSGARTSGYWSFGVAGSPRDDHSDISTPNMASRAKPHSSRQSSASDHMRYHASHSIGGNSGGSMAYSSRGQLKHDRLSSSRGQHDSFGSSKGYPDSIRESRAYTAHSSSSRGQYDSRETRPQADNAGSLRMQHDSLGSSRGYGDNLTSSKAYSLRSPSRETSHGFRKSGVHGLSPARAGSMQDTYEDDSPPRYRHANSPLFTAPL